MRHKAERWALEIAAAAKEVVLALEQFNNSTNTNETAQQLVHGIRALTAVLEERVFPILVESDRQHEKEELEKQLKHILAKTASLLGELKQTSEYSSPSVSSLSSLSIVIQVCLHLQST